MAEPDAHPDGSPWLHSPSASPHEVTHTLGGDEDTTFDNNGDHSMDDDGKPTPSKKPRIESMTAAPREQLSSSGISSSSVLAILPLQEGSVLAKSQYSSANLIKTGSATAKGVWVYVQEITDIFGFG
jgi:hypothetical protein